jgi:hypothetical protein
MALKIKNLGSLQHDKDMDRLYALVAAMKKRMPAKDEGALNNSTYEQNCKDVQNHWQKVNQRNSGKRVDINLPAGEVGNAVGHDATDLAKEQAAFEGKPVGKDSFTQRNAIAADEQEIPNRQKQAPRKGDCCSFVY